MGLFPLTNSNHSLLQRWRARTGSFITNVPGISLKERLLIIESDDWGAIRMPSIDTIRRLQNHGVNLKQSVYKYDALASETDLDALFGLLNQFRDSRDRPACLTANVIVANPDFEAIEAGGYEEYHYEHFKQTFERYPQHHRNWEIWQQGMKDNLFKPQFHGREHLQINRWLKALRENRDLTRFGFSIRTTYSGNKDYSFMEAFDWDDPNEIQQQIAILQDGLRMFRETFSSPAQSFIAPCYNWDSRLETTLFQTGIRIIQGLRFQLSPTGSFDLYNRVPHYFGEQNQVGLRFNIRNCFLEPSMNPHKDWVDTCLAQIDMAFRMGKPAVICSHRINYVGFIHAANRDRGLRDLNTVLKTVQKRWPEVQFISTDELSSFWI